MNGKIGNVCITLSVILIITVLSAIMRYYRTIFIKKQHPTVYPGKKQRPNMAPSGDMFLKVLEMHPEILQQILSTVLNVIMFEDCRNQWSMSRPLLGLILLNEDYFNQMRESIIRSQPLDKQAAMVQWFENLMDGIERNLLTKNRDK